jgi:D-lyxose ketol-isomerase/sugar/nucleoside kinase (ribokinase family)
MKRSEINAIIRDADAFIRSRGFYLPPFAYWTPEDWATKGEEAREIVANGLGWDITDFGRGDYEKYGLFLFTVRNGNPKNLETRQGKLYAEKLMIVGVDQVTLMHFHWHKTEDIINRGGGKLVIQLYNATQDEDLANTDVTVSTDGVRRVVKAGDTVVLSPGESITLTPRYYHQFWGAEDRVLVGEVSTVNDDYTDNPLSLGQRLCALLWPGQVGKGDGPMRQKCDAVVAGHICLDVIPDLSAGLQKQGRLLFRPGHLLEAGPVTLSTGGAISTGLSLHKLGIPTQLIGKVGDDLLGQVVRQILGAHGPYLADDMMVDEAVSTSYTIIISAPGVDRSFLHYPGANDAFGAGDVRYDAVAQARLFHLGYPPAMKRLFENDGAQLVEIFRRVREVGVTTSLDMTLPDPTSPAGRADWVAILGAVMPYVDVFLPSIQETLYMLRREAYEELLSEAGGDGFLSLVSPSLLSDLGRELLEMGAKIVGFKLGDRGLYVRTAGQAAIEALGSARPSDVAAWASRELWAPCFQVDVVGTTGAGDAAIAGFFSGLLRDMSPQETLTAAVAVGACNVEAADALGGVRSWEETWRRVESGWARCDLVLDAPGWHFDDHHQMWVGPAGHNV